MRAKRPEGQEAPDDGPDLPERVAHLWEWYLDLEATKSSNGIGANPISYLEIQAWAALTQSAPTPWEVDVLRQMDEAAFRARHPELAPKTPESQAAKFRAALEAHGVKKIKAPKKPPAPPAPPATPST